MSFWEKEIGEIWNSSGFFLIFYLVLVSLLVFVLVRIRRFLSLLVVEPFWQSQPFHHLALLIARRSLVLAGMTVIVYIATFIDALYFATPSLDLVVNLLLLWLLTAWWISLFRLWNRDGRPEIPPRMLSEVGRALWLIRYIGSFYFIFASMLESSSPTLALFRICLEIVFATWTIFLWRHLRELRVKTSAPIRLDHRFATTVLTALVQSAAIGGLAADLAGYSTLAVYWYLSLGRFSVVLLWWGLFFFMLREWDKIYVLKQKKRDDYLPEEDPVQWLVIRFAQLLWLVSLGIAVILAWGGRRAVLTKIFGALEHPFQIGNMELSIMGFVYAILALLATRATVRLWRYIFLKKFLRKSGLEIGLQDSVTTLTSYIIWMFGILISLHVFGMNTASLAVAFGALGIGLGFGLQNIFNNFISGIILLFERPIQVGDDVEINGVWATVKKINVRSTVVQTYDNAPLIIPNSEFVSNQVTNWSFKDKRVRRNIEVGVAYGSDVELVRHTLMEIADNTPKVLKQPKPDVVFRDFGDSALIFRLRLWTVIDHMWTVETAVRFEIDRLFRERKIEIAFPRRDIHIRSTVKNGADSLPIGDRVE